MGGFYDHVAPLVVDPLGYGMPVPGLVISHHARSGLVDHQTLSFDAYLKFIEDDFMAATGSTPAPTGDRTRGRTSANARRRSEI